MSLAKAMGAIGSIFSLLIIAYVSSQIFPPLDKAVDNTLQTQPALKQSYDTTRTIQDTAGTYSDTRDLLNEVLKLLISFGIPAGIVYGGYRYFIR